MARPGFKALRYLVKELCYGPEPIGLAGATVLAVDQRAELSGQMGTVHWGAAGSPETTCSEWIVSPQVFQGAAQLGASTTPVVQEYPALPNVVPPANMPTWIQDWSAMEGLVP